MGGICTFILQPIFFLRKYNHLSLYDANHVCNGVIVGLVSICSSVDRIEPWAAISIAAFSTLIYVILARIV